MANIDPLPPSTPQFTVVIPTYNRETMLARTLESVLHQTHTDCEIIVVDDGSTDSTGQVVEKYMARDQRIKYSHQENRGACAARNLGASLSRGDYLIFLDDDDTVDPGWLEAFATEIDSDDIAVVCCGCQFVDNSRVWKSHQPSQTIGLFLGGTFAIQQSLFHQAGGYREHLRANQQSEFRLRVLPILRAEQRIMKRVLAPLVTSYQHKQPKIREDLPAIYESSLFVLREHHNELIQDPQTFASWSTSAGGYAAKLGKFSKARELFIQAARAYPPELKNYARVLVSLIPGLRWMIWRQGLPIGIVLRELAGQRPRPTRSRRASRATPVDLSDEIPTSAPQFSIVIPTYNREKLLPRTLESVLRQTFTDCEIIVADDGSTDATRQIVEQYMAQDRRVRYLHQENRGACAARNLGATVANGAYLAFLDDDDTVDPIWLEAFSEQIESGDEAIIFCGCRYIDNGKVWKTQQPTQVNGMFLGGTFAIRQSLFHQIGGYRENLLANQQSEFRYRVLPIMRSEQLVHKVVLKSLVTSYRHEQPKIREDLPAIYESSIFVLQQHRDQLSRNPVTFANWLTSSGGYAAKLGEFRGARRLFSQAVRANPKDPKNYARVLLTWIPGLRWLIWNKRHRK